MEVGLQSGLQGQQEFYQGSSSFSGMPCIKVANKISRRESVHLLGFNTELLFNFNLDRSYHLY